MTDSRPRPQYGEYASPEEQARAIGIPLKHASHTASPAAPAERSDRKSEHSGRAVQHPEVAGPDAVDFESVARVKRSRDTVITVLLLVVGLVWVLLSAPETSDLAGTLNRTYLLQGYTGHYGPVALASTLGLVINISSLVLWGVTCAVSIVVLRRHRRAFYIPLIGAVVSGLVVIALTLVAMVNDPGLLAYLSTLQK